MVYPRLPGMLARSPDAKSGFPANSTNSEGLATRRPAVGRILVVEDQEDVRRMLATALTLEGHQVVEAADALEGLACLEQQRFQLVLSDYSMPGRTGTSMLREASERGLLRDTTAVIITAHPEVQSLPGIPVISKPLDLDRFLEQVRRLLKAGAPQLDRRSADAPVVELVLYISSWSSISQAAREVVEDAMTRFDPERVLLTVCDLARDPLAGQADHIVSTPTLVRRSPFPRVLVLGSIPEAGVVMQLLRDCGLEPRTE